MIAARNEKLIQKNLDSSHKISYFFCTSFLNPLRPFWRNKMGEAPTLEELYKEVRKANQALESIRHFFKINEAPSLDVKKWAADKALKFERKLNAKVERGS
jgi:hypothetical protein